MAGADHVSRREHYERHHASYAELYPGVEAAAPDSYRLAHTRAQQHAAAAS